jgi:hypothetical protein
MEGMENATWHEGAHVRDMALSYALLLLRSRILTTENYLAEAGKMWEFLREGTVPMQLVTADDMPDDLSSFDPGFTANVATPVEKKAPSLTAADDATKEAIAQIFGFDPSKIERVNFIPMSPSPEETEAPLHLDDRIVNQEWDTFDQRAGGYATNPGIVQQHQPGIVSDDEDGD